MVASPSRRWAVALLVFAALRSPKALRAASPAKLRVEVRDRGSGKVIPARFYLTDAAGKHWAPTGAITYDKNDEHHFISSGPFSIDLPAGRYTLTCERGPEYRPHSGSIDLKTSEERSITIQLEHWIDMNRLGWFSGDLHNHRKLDEMPQLLLADDLNFSPVLTQWIWEDRPVSTTPKDAVAVRQVDATHAYSMLNEEIERLESGPGAVDLLGLISIVPFIGYRLSPPNDQFCTPAHAQHAYVDAEKIMWRDVAALVALGLVDFAGVVHNHFNRHNVLLETDKWGMIPKERPEFNTVAGMPLWAMDVYYRFLNCGFRLPVSGGSASGVMASPLGYNRVYVKVSRPFGVDRWLSALKAGRNFATNGPMIFLTVNGLEPGASLKFAGRQAHKLRVQAEASSTAPLDRLEIIHKGRVIRSAAASGNQEKLVLDFDFPVDHSGWLAARCFERPGTTVHFAQTSPVYMEFAGRSGVVPQDAKFFINWMDREIGFYKAAPGFRNGQDRALMIAFFEKARAIYSALLTGK